MELNSGNQFIVMTLSDFETLVNNVAKQNTLSSTNQEIRPKKYLTRKEAAALLRVDLSTLWRWEKAGILVARHTGTGGRVLYDSDTIEAIIHER